MVNNTPDPISFVLDISNRNIADDIAIVLLRSSRCIDVRAMHGEVYISLSRWGFSADRNLTECTHGAR